MTFDCIACGKTYAHKINLEKHQKAHAGFQFSYREYFIAFTYRNSFVIRHVLNSVISPEPVASTSSSLSSLSTRRPCHINVAWRIVIPVERDAQVISKRDQLHLDRCVITLSRSVVTE